MTAQPSNVIAFPVHRARGTAEPFMTKAEVAEHLKVTPRWIELRMKRDGLPFYKDARSRLVRFRMSEVEGWLAARRAG